MKKFLKALFGVVAALVLVACGGGEGTTEEGAVSDDEPLEVAMIIQSLGDLSFNDNANSGLESAREEFGDQVDIRVLEYGMDNTANIEPSFLDTADTNPDVMIMPSQFTDVIQQYAPDYPETDFWVFDTSFDFETYDYDNVYAIVYKANEASYLGGYASASTSETGKIGFIGGMDNNIIGDFLVGFIEGAQQADPDIKVATAYVGAWNDSARGKEQAIAMFNQDVSQIFNVAGGSGVGIIEGAVEQNKYAIGVDGDQAMMYKEMGQEDFANAITTSVLKNVGKSLHRAIGLQLKGELPLGTTEYLGLKEDGVGLAMNEITEAFYDPAVLEEINAIRDQIENGEIEVSTSYDMTVEEIAEIRDSVAP